MSTRIEIIQSSSPPAVTRSTATLMKTGQTVSYLTGDDGDLQEGRETDWFTLDTNNPFGNTNRFTDVLGGATYTDNILIDWSTYNGSTVLALAFDNFLLSGFDTLANHIILANSYSLGGFTGWRIPNFNELWNFMKKGDVNLLNYSPINYTGVNIFASSTRATSTSIFCCRVDQPNNNFIANPNTSSSRPILVRTFTVTGTTLT